MPSVVEIDHACCQGKNEYEKFTSTITTQPTDKEGGGVNKFLS